QTISKNSESVNVKNFNNALAELMPLNTSSNKQINELINQVPVTLESGSYEIIDAEIKNDALKLTVASDSSSEPIKISLPLEQLKLAPSNSGFQSQRVNLVEQSQQKIELESLIRNLNLKELTVHYNNDEALKSEQVGISNSKNNIVNIEITAEGSGQVQFIKGKLLKSSVRTTQKNNQINSNNNISGEENELQNSSRDIITEKNEPVLRRQFSPKNQNFGREQLLNVTNNKSQNIVNENLHSSNSDMISANTNDIDKLIELNRTASPKNESQPVKFNLPDDIRTALKPNGKSVNILIEPENLGPARLKLVLNNQTLRAELTVQNVHAKTTVENSLSQLIEQLNRSDIKVDFIDVNINSENNQEQFAKRNPQWLRKSFSNNSENLKDDTLAYVPSDEITGKNQRLYVGSEGVNVLA
ncbi:MAG: flagellar hook-length control protein FliK, partial [candidate division Zixibacteria bacterium]|nr:flagellar hook-length control protein FliK [candidate division Zixibacteria bacterium]